MNENGTPGFQQTPDSAPSPDMPSQDQVRFAQAQPGQHYAQPVPAPQEPNGPQAYAMPDAYQAPVYDQTFAPAPVAVAKKSKLPWLVLALAIVAVLVICVVGIRSCTDVMTGGIFSTFGSSTGSVTSGETVAVIHIEGTISATDAENPETLAAELDRAEADDNVVAIVLRITSGGGTAAASEEMAQYVADCSKPVVVSVGDSCASGAYMVASQADYIYTSEGATVGSIGVIITQYNLSELLDTLGISVETITSGEDKDEGAYWAELSDEQRAALQEEVDLIHHNFVSIVAEGRGLTYDEVAAIATGRTWTGSQIIELGLMDEIGTYRDACAKAAELGGITGDYDVVSFDSYVYSPLDMTSLL